MNLTGSVEIPVLIVGGSIVGLSLSLFLAQHGVQALTVERHPSTSLHPRARALHPRTIELMRASGVASRLEQLGTLPPERRHVPQLVAATLAGPVTQTRELSLQTNDESWSPSRFVYLGQDRAEPIILQAARDAGADVRFGCELVAWQSGAQGVVARVRACDSEHTFEVRAQYLLAADGVRSGIRERLGIAQSGRGSLGHNLAILFEADLSEAGQRFGFAQITHPDAAGVLVATDVPDRYIYSFSQDPSRGSRTDDLAQRLRVATGLPKLVPKILGSFPWEVAERVAERFSLGRVFLVGDAAHQMPPTGAFGANTGIHDAANLAWKLAWVLHGRASAELLDSYHAERQPVARATAEHATVSALRMSAAGRDATREIVLPDEACVMRAYCYGATPAIDLQLSAAQGEARVGARLPHRWLDGARSRSTLDLCARKLVLITADARWAQAAAHSSDHVQPAIVPSASAYGSAVLVRPDQHVAASWPVFPGDPAAELARAVRALAHPR